jgi:hypothetical protein
MPISIFKKYSVNEFYDALKRADPAILEDVLQFLEEDSRAFRSGYLKQKMWRRIRRFSLDQTHIQRLENAAFKYLQRPMTPEFTYMCKTMTSLATQDFWRKVAEKITTGTRQERLNASCLYPYFYGLNAGGKHRATNRRIQHEQARAYTYANYHLFEAHKPEKLVELLHEAEHWQAGQVVRRLAKAEDLPIIYYMEGAKPDFNTDIATLDMSAVSVDLLVPKLEKCVIVGVF